VTSLTALVIAVLVFNGAILLALPGVARPHLFFSVTVASTLRHQPAGRRIIRHYRLLIVLGSLVAALALLTMATARWRVSTLLLQGTFGLAAWLWARRQARPYVITSAPDRVASLAARNPQLPGGWLAMVGPYVILLAAGVLLFTQWDAIPERFPRHWSAEGTPNRWVHKSVQSVFGTLALGAAVVSLTLMQAVLIVRRTRQIAPEGAAADSEIRFKRGNATYTVASAYVMAALFAYFGTRSIGTESRVLGLEIWAFVGMIAIGALAMTLWMFRVGQGGSRAVSPGDAPVGDRTPDDAWKVGLIYFNPSDPAVLVEKRVGFGWTLNFGNPWSWLLLAGFLVPVAIALLAR
jgi:uncharacterized membrane protein